MTIEERISGFKQDLGQGKLTEEQIVQKHVLDSSSHLFTTEFSPNSEVKVKQSVSDYFKIDLQSIHFVGSSKVGFSMSPKKLFRHIDQKYEKTRLLKDKSDLDIAIISEKLFDRLGMAMFKFSDSYKICWNRNEYYDNTDSNYFPIPLKYKFFEFYTKGWLRPDFKPNGFELCFPRTYEKMKNEIYRETKRKAAVAVYKNWFYFKSYHIENMKNLRNQIETDTI